MKLRHLLLTTGVFLTLLSTPVYSDGYLTYGDKCSVPNAILRVFTNTDLAENEKCNSNQGLICTGTCTCPPTRIWDKGPFFGLFGGGGCIVGANGPCTKTDRCVDNAVCGDNIPLCFCAEGYYAHELQCISSYGHNSVSGASTIKVTWLTYGMIMIMVAKLVIS